MNSTQSLADRLAIYVAAYKHYSDVKTSASLLDGAIFGESFAFDLVKIVFGYSDLENLNLETNFPAVDLGSKEAAIAFR